MFLPAAALCSLVTVDSFPINLLTISYLHVYQSEVTGHQPGTAGRGLNILRGVYNKNRIYSEK